MENYFFRRENLCSDFTINLKKKKIPLLFHTRRENFCVPINKFTIFFFFFSLSRILDKSSFTIFDQSVQMLS